MRHDDDCKRMFQRSEIKKVEAVNAEVSKVTFLTMRMMTTCQFCLDHQGKVCIFRLDIFAQDIVAINFLFL